MENTAEQINKYARYNNLRNFLKILDDFTTAGGLKFYDIQNVKEQACYDYSRNREAGKRYKIKVYGNFHIVTTTEQCNFTNALFRICPLVFILDGVMYYRLPRRTKEEDKVTLRNLFATGTLKRQSAIYITFQSNFRILKRTRRKKTNDEENITIETSKNSRNLQFLLEVAQEKCPDSYITYSDNTIFAFPKITFTEAFTKFKTPETFRTFCVLSAIGYEKVFHCSTRLTGLEGGKMYRLFPKGFPLVSSLNAIKDNSNIITSYSRHSGLYFIQYNSEFVQKLPCGYVKADLSLFKTLSTNYLTGHSWRFLLYILTLATQASNVTIKHSVKSLIQLLQISVRHGRQNALNRLNAYIEFYHQLGIIENYRPLVVADLKTTQPPRDDNGHLFRINKGALTAPTFPLTEQQKEVIEANKERFKNFYEAESKINQPI